MTMTVEQATSPPGAKVTDEDRRTMARIARLRKGKPKVANAERRGKTYKRRGKPAPRGVLRYDPTRTTMLRKAFATRLRRNFARLKYDIVDLVVRQDAFGLRRQANPDTRNAYCPTGEGGGQDNSCSPGNRPFKGHDKQDLFAMDERLLKDRLQEEAAASSEGGGLRAEVAKAAIREIDRQRKQIAEELHARWQSELTGNADWSLKPIVDKIRGFKDWLRGKIAGMFSTKQERGAWDGYIERGYKQGAGRSYDDAKRAERVDEGEFGKSKRSFLDILLGRRQAKEQLQAKQERAWGEWQDVAKRIETLLGRELDQNLTIEADPRTLAKGLTDIMGVEANRAELIARTELIRSYAEGQLDSMEQLGVEQVGALVEFKTAGDAVVCPECSSLEGVVFPVAEARGVIPVHPRCRCAWLPVFGVPSSFDRPAKDPFGEYAQAQEALAETYLEQDVQAAAEGAWEDALATFVLSHARNVFCPTGVGGGVDPTCSPTGGGGSSGTWDKSGDTFPSHGSWKELEPNPKYVYHATNIERVHEISEGSLVPHKASFGTDQREWPDGSTAKRSYFTANPSTAWQFAPVDGKPVLMRIRRTPQFKTESTGDIYLEKLKVPAHRLEVLTEAGWKQLATKPTANVFCPTGPGGGVDPGCSPHGGVGTQQKFVGEKVGKAEHVRAGEIEEEVAAMVGGKVKSFEGGRYSPRDVTLPGHDIEVKSIQVRSNNSISVHDDALVRKADAHAKAEREGKARALHTVVVDDRDRGARADKYSGHRVYYKRGSGRYTLSKMHQVKDARELRRLIKAKDEDLPDKAKGGLPKGKELRAMRVRAERIHQYRILQNRKRRAEGRI